MSETGKKRILIASGIYPPTIGGPASYGRTLARKLSADFEVTVLSYSPVRSFAEDKKENFRVVRVWGKMLKPVRIWNYFFQAIRLVRKADTIYALNAVSAGVPALIAAKMFGRKFIVKIVGDASWERAINLGKTHLMVDDFQKSDKKGLIKVLHKLQCWVCKNANTVIVPSEYLAGIVTGWGIPKEKIKVVYNGVDFRPLELSKEEARRKIGILGHVIVSVGRLVPWKGFRMLIKIMPSIFEINQAFRLIIVGDGPDKAVLLSMIRNLGLEKKVFLVGQKSQVELATYLAAADMFVLNTGYEGFSHQILEAMTAGVPVITTAVGGNKEMIDQGENGFMVRYNDEFNLVEAIRSLWQSPELQKDFIANGKKAVRKFSVDRMLNETLKILII